MGQNPTPPKIEELRRTQRIVKRQIESRTVELEKINESLRDEITKLKQAEQDLNARLQERTAELAKAHESLATERVRSAAMLREREARQRQPSKFYQAVIANVSDGLYTDDSQGLVTYVNPAAERLLGWSSAELLGRKMHDMIHYQHPDGSAFPADKCTGLHVLRKGRFLSNHEDVFIRKDGAFFPVVYSSSPITLDDGIEGSVVVFRDRTAKKQAEETLRRSRDGLRALAAERQAAHEEERRVLAREIHDELSGTLTALKMDLSLLPDRAAKDHHLLLEKLSSMSEHIDRTLARVHAIVTELRPVVLDKFGLVAAIEWQAGEFQGRSGIACKLQLPTDEIPLDSDRSTAFFRILQEALTNIIRHADASQVAVNLKRVEESLVLEVRDNGKGIDESKIYSAESFGLLGIRERALSFGGEAQVACPPEGGTLVTVTIPVK